MISACEPKRTCISGNCINYGSMRFFLSGWIFALAFVSQGGVVLGQSTLDALQAELADAKNHHQEVTAATLSNFFSQIDPAMGSPDAAITLYQSAGGTLPDASPVVKANEDETPSEKQDRLAFDQANLLRLGTALQLECGMMHFGALFVVKPEQPGLKADWIAWLKSAAQIYPKLNVQGGDDGQQPKPGHKKKKDQDGNGGAQSRPPPFNPTDEENKALKDTLITKYLAFTAWGDKEQGGWSVHALPKIYRAEVLEPLRATPNEATLAAWDVYIGMANADEKDNDKWNQQVYPPLQFDRATDDYLSAPGTEKLESLVNMIKANPTNPHADEWIDRVSKLMDAYRAAHGGAPSTATRTPAATTNAASGNPNVTVTTEQQGDMTIVTTHTNAAPANPH